MSNINLHHRLDDCKPLTHRKHLGIELSWRRSSRIERSALSESQIRQYFLETSKAAAPLRQRSIRDKACIYSTCPTRSRTWSRAWHLPPLCSGCSDLSAPPLIFPVPALLCPAPLLLSLCSLSAPSLPPSTWGLVQIYPHSLPQVATIVLFQELWILVPIPRY